MDQIIERLKEILLFDAANPLLFNTGLFMLLFAGLLFVYRLAERHRRAKMLIIIAFSLYFYYKSSAEYCLILLGVCMMDYFLGNLMGRCRQGGTGQKWLIALNVLINVGMLVWFKYFNLLLSTFADMAGRDFDPLEIILPAGISFFTFRSISYMVDIYRGHIKPCTDFMAYVFYLTFFPPLLAGPVVRAKDFLPQTEQATVATRAMVSEGLFLIMCGLVKKVIVADYLSQNFVDRVFDNPALYSGFENLMAIYGFTVQLYCDFSGYSDMAIGIALLLGFRFFDNFRAPFKAESPTEFWHRWHISLSTWLRDYLYIPLGGNRKGPWRARFNQMATMVIGGLWHGASWMYVIWGAWNGLLLAVHKDLKRWFPRIMAFGDKWGWRRVFNIVLTFNLMAFGFMFFRSRSMESVKEMTDQILHNFHMDVAQQFITGYMLIFVMMVAALVFHMLPSGWTQWTIRKFGILSPPFQAVILALILMLCIQFRSADLVPFIYLQY